jgi:hypothetical protein
MLPKLCKNCKHFVRSTLWIELSTCQKFIQASPVSGQVVNRLAAAARSENGQCRPCGIYYEEKKPEDFPRIIKYDQE